MIDSRGKSTIWFKPGCCRAHRFHPGTTGPSCVGGLRISVLIQRSHLYRPPASYISAHTIVPSTRTGRRLPNISRFWSVLSNLVGPPNSKTSRRPPPFVGCEIRLLVCAVAPLAEMIIILRLRRRWILVKSHLLEHSSTSMHPLGIFGCPTVRARR